MGTRAEFVAEMTPYAQRASALTGVDPIVILTQAAHESNWGKSAPGNNYFGIKGSGQTLATHESVGGKSVSTKASFRKYADPEASFLDWANLISTNPRYAAVLEAETPDEAFVALKQAGYATDPKYAQKLSAVADKVAVIAPTAVASYAADRLADGVVRDPELSVGGADNLALVNALMAQYQQAAAPGINAFSASPPMAMLEPDVPATGALNAVNAMGSAGMVPPGATEPYYRSAGDANFGLPPNQYGMDKVLQAAVMGDPTRFGQAAQQTADAVGKSGWGGLLGLGDVTKYIRALPQTSPDFAAFAKATAKADPGLFAGIDPHILPAVKDALANAPADRTGFYPMFNPEMGGGRETFGSTANSAIMSGAGGSSSGSSSGGSSNSSPDYAAASRAASETQGYTSPVSVVAPTATYAPAGQGYVNASPRPAPAPATTSLAAAARAASEMQGAAPAKPVTTFAGPSLIDDENAANAATAAYQKAATMAAMPMPRPRPPPQPVMKPAPVMTHRPPNTVALLATRNGGLYTLGPPPAATPGVSGVRAGPAYGTLRPTDVIGLNSRSNISAMSNATVPGGYVPGAWGGSDPGSLSPTKTFLGG